MSAARLSADNPHWGASVVSVLQDKLRHLSRLSRTGVTRYESDLQNGLGIHENDKLLAYILGSLHCAPGFGRLLR